MLRGDLLRLSKKAGLSGGSNWEWIRHASYARVSEIDVSHFERLLGNSRIIQGDEELAERNTYDSAAF